jgi:hypothetical protein
MKLEVIHGSRSVPKAEQHALLVSVSQRVRAKAEQTELSRQARRIARLNGPTERVSVKRLMLSIEDRFVRGMWVLELALMAEGARAHSGRNGVNYFHERSDVHSIYADAPGGKFDSVAPRPALPSSKEIDAANEAKTWVKFLPPFEARILSVGALTKRGDAGRRVKWDLVRHRLPEAGGYSLRGLQSVYERALRTIATEMTLGKIGH